MTELRRARWTAAVVLAPGAAALFNAATGWVAHTVPTLAPRPAIPAARSVTSQAVSANDAEVRRLDTAVRELSVRAATVRAEASGLGRDAARRAAEAAAARQAALKAPPVTAVPPPVFQATTGASR